MNCVVMFHGINTSHKKHTIVLPGTCESSKQASKQALDTGAFLEKISKDHKKNIIYNLSNCIYS